MVRVRLDFDVPYGGGYSNDYSTVYIDRGIPEYFTAYDGAQYPLRDMLIAHEIVEIQYLRTYPTYNEAHYLSTQNDVRRLRVLGVPIDEYFGHLHHYVTLALTKYRLGFAHLPPDLNMLPYIEDGLITLPVK